RPHDSSERAGESGQGDQVKTGISQQAAATRRTVKYACALCAMLLALCSPVEAKQSKKVARIGYLSLGAGIRANDEAFREGLRQLGYREGHNIVIEWRFVDGRSERYRDLAAELVRLKVDAIVTASGDDPIIAAMKATKTIPIVILTGSDPVARGFVASLTHPGGNVTGVSYMLHELNGKRLELLKEVVPKLVRVAILGDPDHRNYKVQMNEVKSAAQGLGLDLQPVQIRAAEDLENAFSFMAQSRAGALLVLSNPAIGFFLGTVVQFAAKTRIPGIYATPGWVSAGGLMSYAPAYADQYRRAAAYVDKILKGTNPRDLPVERPIKFELVINLEAAKQIGLTIPPSVLARADRVIK
ncbi:MAG TPA: ABC transporter substrate-binding protein, partial [Candidatus Binatia bacterium]